MTAHLALLAVVSLCFTDCKASCEMEVAESYIDVAVDMIVKAKNKYPGRVDCENVPSRKAADCSELLQMGHTDSGVYMIWPPFGIIQNKSLDVYCDMETSGGGWTVIQRRGNFGKADDYFYKDWKSYKEGFGDIREDFWLGNDNIFNLTNQKFYSVRFDLKDVENNTRYAQYDSFWIGDETTRYILHVEGYSGNAGDSMTPHNGYEFTTKDQDNDVNRWGNCAEQCRGAWWYHNCIKSNLNGLYLRGRHEVLCTGTIWFGWTGYYESLESTEIKIRPRNFVSQDPRTRLRVGFPDSMKCDEELEDCKSMRKKFAGSIGSQDQQRTGTFGNEFVKNALLP